MASDIGKMMLAVELRAGARLFKYKQLIGGTTWHLTNARAAFVSLAAICDAMEAEGLIEPDDNGERGEYKLWQRQ